MEIHHLNLQPKPFEAIKSGQKIIESRLYDEKRQRINLGDTIRFNLDKTEEVLDCEVVGLLRYPTFRDLVKDFPASYFGGNDSEEVVADLSQFYTAEQQKELGVVGIKLRLL